MCVSADTYSLESFGISSVAQQELAKGKYAPAPTAKAALPPAKGVCVRERQIDRESVCVRAL